MKLMKCISFFLFAISCCTAYAHENKSVLIGQNGHGPLLLARSVAMKIILTVLAVRDVGLLGMIFSEKTK